MISLFNSFSLYQVAEKFFNNNNEDYENDNKNTYYASNEKSANENFKILSHLKTVTNFITTTANTPSSTILAIAKNRLKTFKTSSEIESYNVSLPFVVESHILGIDFFFKLLSLFILLLLIFQF